MKASGQKLTRHKRLHRRLNRKRNRPLITSWTQKRERRSGFAEALADGELHLFKPRRETYREALERMARQDTRSFRNYWSKKTSKGGKTPVPTAKEVKHMEEALVQNKAQAQKKSFFQGIKTGFKKIFQRKVG